MSSRIDWTPALPIDPGELYLFSLRTGRRLPDQLHEHMMLWSFDDNAAPVVKDYLEWIEHCKRRDEAAELTRRRMQSIEKMDKALNLLGLVAAFALVVALVVSGRI